MDSRLAIISGATFAGIVGAAALIAGLPGFGSTSNDSNSNVAPVSITAPANDSSGSSGFALALDTAVTANTAIDDSASTDESDHETAEHKSKDDSHHDDGDVHDDHHDDDDD